MTLRHSSQVLALTAALLFLPAGCARGGEGDRGELIPDVPSSAGDAATWELAEPPLSDATNFTAMVTRVGCHGGSTGEVSEPFVAYGEEEIVVAFRVLPRAAGGAFTCEGNDYVEVAVRLVEPIGNRALVDGACRLETSLGSTAFCDTGGVRWRP